MPSLNNPFYESVDCIITTIPLTITTIPLMAPATLKPVVQSAGLTCKAIDLNNDVHNFISDMPEREEIINFLDTFEFNDSNVPEIISDLYSTVVDDLLSFGPEVVCISLLTTSSQKSAEWMVYLLKKANPDLIIIAGGAGCLNSFVGSSGFIETMLSEGLIDYHIRGDGEHALYELLTGNKKFGGINSENWKQLTRDELAALPIPDYEDYKFDQYLSASLPILGSRGCVRKCQYCDYIENWKKFTWRDANDIFNEMKYQYNTYGIRSFKFQDSLINGNVKEFNKLMRLMGDWNESNPQEKFSWGGFYIFRNVNDNSEYEWDLIKRSNAAVLTVGIENLNEDIRFLIGKKFSNEAIDYHLEKALRLNIKVSLLFIVGYVTEDFHHIEFIKEWLKTHTKYKDILHLKWGDGLAVLPDTYLYNHKEALGISLKNTIGGGDWIDLNTGHDLAQRKKWCKELIRYSAELGYVVRADRDDHYILEQILNEMSKNEVQS